MQGIISAVKGVFSSIGFIDILDILIMTYLIYQVILLARKTRAVQLLKGILVLLLCYFVARQLGLKTVNFVLSNFLQFGIIAVITKRVRIAAIRLFRIHQTINSIANNNII